MSIARIPTIRAKVARQAQLVRRLALETSATQTTRHPAQPSRSLARSLGAPAALLLSVFHLTPAAAKALPKNRRRVTCGVVKRAAADSAVPATSGSQLRE